ncbi:hypothetical protein ACIXMT_17265 [Bacteroides fragilis]
MKKLTRKSLNELAKTMPVIEESLQMSYVGGGNGTSANPYTQEEYESMVSSGIWNGGYVENWGYTFLRWQFRVMIPITCLKRGWIAMI